MRALRPLLLLLLAALPACDVFLPERRSPAVRVELTPRSVSFASIDSAAGLAVTAYDRWGNVVPGVPVTIVSRDSTVVVVQPGNLARAAGTGSTYIVASLDGVGLAGADSVPAVVRQVAVTIAVTAYPGSILVGEQAGFSAFARDGNGHPIAEAGFTWVVDDASIATVDGTGRATGSGPGTTRIVARLDAAEGSTPLTVAEPTNALAVTAGTAHACYLQVSGTVYCWGANVDSQVGVTAFAPLPGANVCVPGPCLRAPMRLAVSVRFESIAAGDFHTCGLTATGEAWCWGRGTGPEPRRVTGMPPLTTLNAGGTRTCGLTAAGEAFCWEVTGMVTSSAPVSLGARAFATLSPHTAYTCGTDADGVGYCWGANARGQLGTGDTFARTLPVEVAGGHRWARLEAGGDLTCGVTTGGQVHCWSGAETAAGPEYGLSPTLVVGGRGIAQLAVEAEHGCAVDTAGELLCWGRTVVDFQSPSPWIPHPPALVGTGFTSVSAGGLGSRSLNTIGTFDCGIRAGGMVQCRGANRFGQLGNPDATGAVFSDVARPQG